MDANEHERDLPIHPESRVEPLAAERAADLLNEALALDPEAVSALVNVRVPCNEALAKHPTIQCGIRGGGTTVGLLGVLNGIIGIGADGRGALAARIDSDTGRVESFIVLAVEKARRTEGTVMDACEHERVRAEACAAAWRVYDEACAPARRVYDEACAPAWRVYDEACVTARRVYDEACVTARRVRDEACAPARQVYDEACVTARRVRDEALAAAERAHNEACAALAARRTEER